jgi:hypothetical protein
MEDMISSQIIVLIRNLKATTYSIIVGSYSEKGRSSV